MQTTKWQHESSIIQRLIDEPHRFTFVQALHLLLNLLRKSGVSYETAFTHVLRFRNSLQLNFPASEIEALVAGGVTEARTATMLRLAIEHDPGAQIAITPAFVGFLGPSGALPYHYSERIAAVQREQKNQGPRAFLDMFSNRATGLFYQGWRKYRIEQAVEVDGEDLLLPKMLALASVDRKLFEGGNRNVGVSDYVAAYYAALIATRPVSANTLARVLSAYFAVPIGVEEFVGQWFNIPDDQRSQLKGASFKLGHGGASGAITCGCASTSGPLTKKILIDFCQGVQAPLPWKHC